MPSLKGFKTYISCDGVPLDEFQVQLEDSGNAISCWVPSQAGKSFGIHWIRRPADIAFSVHTSIDGIRLGVKTYRAHKVQGFREDVAVDDDALEVRRLDTSSIGTITVSIYHVRISIGRRDAKSGFVHIPGGPIHEKDKKLGSHVVQIGKTVPYHMKRIEVLRPEPHDPSNPGPFVTFHFKYRSPDFLQAEGIMPKATALAVKDVPVSLASASEAIEPRERRASADTKGPLVKKPQVMNLKRKESEEDVDEDILAMLEKQITKAQKQVMQAQKRILQTQRVIQRLKRKRVERPLDSRVQSKSRSRRQFKKAAASRAPVVKHDVVIDLTSD